MNAIIDRAEWADTADAWSGEWQGAPHGADISVIFVTYDEPGRGPRLHTHPYSETFIVRKGRALFTLGGKQIEVTEGQIAVAPAGVPHKFVTWAPAYWSRSTSTPTAASSPNGWNDVAAGHSTRPQRRRIEFIRYQRSAWPRLPPHHRLA